MTKRIIALLLVFSFIFSFSACKGDEIIETTTESTTESTTKNTIESTTESTTQVPILSAKSWKTDYFS